MRLTADEAADKGLLPLEVRDANGVIITRKITEFDLETGFVEYYVEPFTIIDGDLERRTEHYPAPLTWRKL